MDIDFLRDLVDSPDCDIASLLETIGDLEGVEALVEKFLSLFKESSGEDDDTSGTVTDFVVLTLGEFH